MENEPEGKAMQQPELGQAARARGAARLRPRLARRIRSHFFLVAMRSW